VISTSVLLEIKRNVSLLFSIYRDINQCIAECPLESI